MGNTLKMQMPSENLPKKDMSNKTDIVYTCSSNYLYFCCIKFLFFKSNSVPNRALVLATYNDKWHVVPSNTDSCV